MNSPKRNLILLHLIVFLYGWTAILGKIITLPALQMVWIRVIFALAGILVYSLYKRSSWLLDIKTIIQLFAIGVLVGVHWICFFESVKVGNISIALVCFASGSLFTSVMEPFITKRKILLYEIIFGLIVIGALLLIFNVETEYFVSILFGLSAAATSALMAILNSIMRRKKIKPEIISAYEMVGCLACVSIFILILEPQTATLIGISNRDWFYLFLFGILCTTFPFIVGVKILESISPYTMSLTLNLETVYGILFAFFLFKESEYMTATFYMGVIIILAVVFADSHMKKQKNLLF